MRSDVFLTVDSARTVHASAGSAFLLEPLEQRRFLDATSATVAIDAGFGQAGYAAPMPVGVGQPLAAYAKLTPAGNGQFYAVAYDGSWAWPQGFTSFELLRVNGDGSLDTSFGTGGAVHVERPDPQYLPTGELEYADDSLTVGNVFVQPDGKVLLSFRAVPQFSPDPWLLMRLNADGSTDAGFGDAGTVTIPVTRWSQNAPTTWLQPDGKIDVADADVLSADGVTENVRIRQFNADGTPDESFGVDGVDATSYALPTPGLPLVPGQSYQYTNLGGGAALANGGSVLYLLQQSGSFSTDESDATYLSDCQVVALTVDAHGNVLTSAVAYESNPSGTEAASGDGPTVAVQPDGKAVVLDPIADRLLRVNADGSADPTLDVSANVPDGFVAGLFLQPDGRIVVVANDQYSLLQGLERFNTDGTPDVTLAGGQMIFGFGDRENVGGVTTAADGSLILGTDDVGWWADYDPTGTHRGAQLVHLTPRGGTPSTFDAQAAEAAIQLALFPPPPPEPVDVATDPTADDGSDAVYTDDATSDDGGSADGVTYDDSTDPAAYRADGSADADAGDNLFSDAAGTTAWNPDGTPAVV